MHQHDHPQKYFTSSRQSQHPSVSAKTASKYSGSAKSSAPLTEAPELISFIRLRYAMISKKKIRFLLGGLALGCSLAILILNRAAPERVAEQPSGNFKSDTSPSILKFELNPSTAAQSLETPEVLSIPDPGAFGIAVRSTNQVSEEFRIKVDSVSNQKNPAEETIRRAANQKYHLIYRPEPAPSIY
jgi:hypothetical protein